MDKQIFMNGLAAATVAGLAAVPLAVAVLDSTNDVLEVLKKVTSETINTLDCAWEIALRFKYPNYAYNPQDFINAAKPLNSTIASIDFSNATSPG